jgi:hypothetical protein
LSPRPRSHDRAATLDHDHHALPADNNIGNISIGGTSDWNHNAAGSGSAQEVNEEATVDEGMGVGFTSREDYESL